MYDFSSDQTGISAGGSMVENDYFDLPFEVSLYANREGIILVRLVRDFAEQPLLRDYLEQDPIYLRESCDLPLFLTELIERCR